MRKLIACMLLVFTMAGLFGQNAEDWLWNDSDDEKPAEEAMADTDFIRVNFQKKDARRAMLYSMLLPGAGQFYADKSAITTYIFPVLEIGLIAGMLVYNSSGDKKTKDFERYANGEEIVYELGDGTVITTTRYDRDRQTRVEGILLGLSTVDIYESSYFRLDGTNTQHFYEDIGKYPHYVFGWADWYYHFATNAEGVDTAPIWYPEVDTNNPGWVWNGNYPLWDDEELGYNTAIPIDNRSHASSRMRKKYVEMRNAAKDDYAIARGFTFGIAANHLASGLDAIRVSRNANKGALSDNGLRFNYYAALRNNMLTPTLALHWKF